MSKHTPGPWVADDGYSATHLRIRSEDWGTIADVNDPYNAMPDGELEANARLIAAAPELLEAAKWMVGRLHRTGLDVAKGPRAALEVAIAKAEGR
jgi:hypothetical protein